MLFLYERSLLPLSTRVQVDRGVRGWQLTIRYVEFLFYQYDSRPLLSIYAASIPVTPRSSIASFFPLSLRRALSGADCLFTRCGAGLASYIASFLVVTRGAGCVFNAALLSPYR